MEQNIQARVMHLDNLLKQLLRMKKSKGSDSVDVSLISKNLKDQLASTLIDIKRELWVFEDIGGTKLGGLSIKSEYNADYKIKRVVKAFQTLSQMIEQEVGAPKSPMLSSQDYQELDSKDEWMQMNQQQLLLKSRDSEEIEPLHASKIIKIYDYDLEQKIEENKTLEACTKATQDLHQLQSEINQNLMVHREKLTEADKEAYKAAKTSNEALEITKDTAKRKWSILPWKLGLFSAIGGAVVGGGVALVPGAAVGGVTGGVAGGAIGSKIKKEARKDINKVSGQKPELLDKSEIDEPVHVLRVAKKK